MDACDDTGTARPMGRRIHRRVVVLLLYGREPESFTGTTLKYTVALLGAGAQDKAAARYENVKRWLSAK